MATTENVGTAAIGEGTIRTVNTPSGSVEEKRLTAGLEFELASGVRHNDSLEIFVGPLDYTLLDKYPDDLEGLLDIGTTPWVGWIVKPFALAVIWLLPLMYAVIPNYGVCIILFALLIKLLTLPLSLKTFKSMAAMRDMGPKLEKLKVKYKDNPQALTSETMKLYKDAGVNPFSGCLPMLAQMPIFFALFSVFRSSILLRHAPFVGFVNDLSHGASSFTDPYIILVVLMIGAQFLSSFITSSNQPQQNKMFLYIFPVIMGFMFYSFAAGLVLYWTAFSLFSLIDWYIFRRSQPKNAHIQEA
jgi:YidC/Oxa1 family membrane protein insertase